MPITTTPKIVDRTVYLDWVLENWEEVGNSMLQIGAPQVRPPQVAHREVRPPQVQAGQVGAAGNTGAPAGSGAPMDCQAVGHS